MTPHDDSDLLEERLRHALAARAATTRIPEPPGVDLTTRRDAVPSTDASWWRPVAVAAAVVVVVGGLLVAAGRVVDTGDRTDATIPGAPDAGLECGTELPFAFPAPVGFDGPTTRPDPTSDDLLLRWQGAGETVDVAWPSFPPLDPTNPYTSDRTWVSEDEPASFGDRSVRTATFTTPILGTGACVALDVTVSTPDARATDDLLDRIELGLAGPDGPLAGPSAGIVAGSRVAPALPDVQPCTDVEPGEPTVVDGEPSRVVAPSPTPLDALRSFVATAPRVATHGWEEVTLPDGSLAYTWGDDPARPTIVVHLVQGTEGWAVESWRASSC